MWILLTKWSMRNNGTNNGFCLNRDKNRLSPGFQLIFHWLAKGVIAVGWSSDLSNFFIFLQNVQTLSIRSDHKYEIIKLCLQNRWQILVVSVTDNFPNALFAHENDENVKALKHVDDVGDVPTIKHKLLLNSL